MSDSHDGGLFLNSAEPDAIDWLRHARAASASDPSTPQCLDDDRVGAFAEGTLDAAERAAAVAHLASCARCRGAVASVGRALVDPDVAREVAALDTASRRWRRYALPAAAALLIALLGPLELFRRERGETHRAPTIANGSFPSAVTPQGAVAEVRELRWAPVAGADRYRVTIFGAEGHVVYEAEPLGGVASLPDSLVLAPGRRYLWKVEARVGFDRWVSSDLVEFTLVGRPGR